MKKILISLTVVLFLFFVSFSFFYEGSSSFLRSPFQSSVVLPENLTREEVAKVLGKELSWNRKEKESFAPIFSQMQWLTFAEDLAEIASEEFDWTERDREVFLTSTAKYFKLPDDPLNSLYIAGPYEFSGKEKKVSMVAGSLVSRIKELHGENIKEFISQTISEEGLLSINDFVSREQELLPDLVPLPAQDIVLSEEGGKILLRFSTVYYNQGRGPLELRADPNTSGIRSDIERDVFQRIYHEDGFSFRDEVAGKFLWHQEHLHYHFEDFAVYDLEVVKVDGEAPDLSGNRVKSTFCIRDVSQVDIDIPNKEADAKYLICGKELQGISVGWGDTYFYNYPDQLMDVSDLPSGVYSLATIVNPANRFDEISADNNRSMVVIDINMENKTVEIVSEEPSKYPAVEHVYPEQDCKNCTL